MLSRREVAAGLLASAGGAAESTSAHEPGSVVLRAAGPGRRLPERWLGYNADAPFNVPIEDPAFVRRVVELSPQLIRFPGGTSSNYYQWRTGTMLPVGRAEGPMYERYGGRSKRLHPSGVHIEQYLDLARAARSELLVVCNLETSEVAEQAAWLRRMNDLGFRPELLEMGNEFFLLPMVNPAAVARFPDWPTTARLSRRYAEALRPFLAGSAKVAVQAAASTYHNPSGTEASPFPPELEAGLRLASHERAWDQALSPAPWFDAVTLHLYPTIEGTIGRGALDHPALDRDRLFDAMLARCDAGVDRVIRDTVAQAPGKEVWITEFGAFEPKGLRLETEVIFDGIWFHSVVRSVLSFLRHPEVRMAVLHSLFADGDLLSGFGGAAGGYAPINATNAMAWFMDALRGPQTAYHPLEARGSRRVRGRGTIAEEDYADLAAFMLSSGRRRTLFVHNASPRAARLAGALLAESPRSALVMATPDLRASLMAAAPPAQVLAGPSYFAPAWSLCRFDWV